MKERLYRAFTDNGHDYSSFTFYSCHRANSKENLQDAERELRQQFGKFIGRTATITSTSKE